MFFSQTDGLVLSIGSVSEPKADMYFIFRIQLNKTGDDLNSMRVVIPLQVLLWSI